jgi:aminopeptidase N
MMRTDVAPPVRLADYVAPDWLVPQVDLDFVLDPNATRVRARLTLERNGDGIVPVWLDGEALALESISIDGRPLDDRAFSVNDRGLTLHAPPARKFVLETVARIAPVQNTRLEGLYMSGGRYCTQCEAEGFRRITWFPDRPDVLARFSVRIEADRESFPTLLSNGDPVEAGRLEGGGHFAVWRDPHPKPAYLFALCAGDYDVLADEFVTRSGRKVTLGIYVDHGEAPRAAYAMDSLKRSMRWDEEVFGREYDLDVFNIVAVRDFNFGAMENKGLNIFNAAYVLADPETATDADYEAIESIVAHEYFHNWTGNRITLRDWFQLCLKEGLTVYRDQEFSADMRSRAVQRIHDVLQLRARQFSEDAGPLAHNVRPTAYAKIDNFYTATVYEKGATLVRVIRALIGDDAFKRGMDHYFDRCDGTAATVEDFIASFEAASGKDLSSMHAWYGQAGTPRVTVRSQFDAAAGTLTLHLTQATPATPGQPVKAPAPIPLRIGMTGAQGWAIASRLEGAAASREEHLVILDTHEKTLRFDSVTDAPAIAIHRGLDAPISVDDGLTLDQRLTLMAHDADPLTRWDVGQTLAQDHILANAGRRAGGEGMTGAPRLVAALGAEFARRGRDPAFTALALRMPSVPDLMQAEGAADPDHLYAAREHLRAELAIALGTALDDAAFAGDTRPFTPDATSAGVRALKGAALGLIATRGPAAGKALLAAFEAAGNMTSAMAALEALGASGAAEFETALAQFRAKAGDNQLVLDKWYAVQVAAPGEAAVAKAEALIAAPDFDWATPNRVRAVAGVLPQRNPMAFHAADGSGHRFLTNVVRQVDGRNPALAARLLGAFGSFRRLSQDRQVTARAALEALSAVENLSGNTRDILDRTLK